MRYKNLQLGLQIKIKYYIIWIAPTKTFGTIGICKTVLDSTF